VISTTWAAVRARRLERHSLVERAEPARLVEVVGNTCGIQAQVMAAAELSLAVRVDRLTRADVHDALWQERTLVKAWTVRGTLHLHPAHELSLWFAARRATVPERDGLAAWRDPAGVEHAALDAQEVDAVRLAVWDALDGTCLSREELVDAVAGRIGSAARARLRSGFAFFLGEVCQGPPRGPKVTFVRPDQWLAEWKQVDAREALRAVCEWYIRAFGPVQPNDFREWFGGGEWFRPADARALFESLRYRLAAVDVEGSRAWVLAGDTAFASERAPVRLLPEYDAYVMGFRERDQLVPDPVRAQIAADGRGRYEGPAGVRFLLADGAAAGLWRRERRGRRLHVRVEPARVLTRTERSQVEQEARRLGSFLGLETDVVIAATRARRSSTVG
jgi:hypothetical protein